MGEKVDTSTATGLLLFRIMASISKYQAGLISKNVLEGLERARERHGGQLPTRGPSLTDRQRKDAEEMLRNTTMSGGRIAELVAVIRATCTGT